MKGQFLVGSHESNIECNIYADRSSLILEWLLLIGIEREYFSIRELVKERNVSLGLVHKVFNSLIMSGTLETIGFRTAKKFKIKKPELILKNWLENYSIVKKCKMRTYQSRFQDIDQMMNALSESNLQTKVVLALHSAAKALGYKNTNLQTLELYLLDSQTRETIEKTLRLEPQERGYEVLLIEPYYKSLLKLQDNPKGYFQHSGSFLTFLDLYHFPLRGREQSEFMAERIPELKRIYKRN